MMMLLLMMMMMKIKRTMMVKMTIIDAGANADDHKAVASCDACELTVMMR